MKASYRLIDKCAKVAAPVFRKQGWTWWDLAVPPDRGQIVKAIEELVRSLRGDVYAVTSGRLMAQRTDDGEVEVWLRLGFARYALDAGGERD